MPTGMFPTPLWADVVTAKSYHPRDFSAFLPAILFVRTFYPFVVYQLRLVWKKLGTAG